MTSFISVSYLPSTMKNSVSGMCKFIFIVTDFSIFIIIIKLISIWKISVFLNAFLLYVTLLLFLKSIAHVEAWEFQNREKGEKMYNTYSVLICIFLLLNLVWMPTIMKMGEGGPVI